MEELVLEGMERAEGKFREAGFIPGILYGDGIEKATAVKFDEKSLNKLISNHGNSAKLWININNSKKYGFIKEVQRNHVSRKLAHIDVQLVSPDHEVKQQIPIIFNGEEMLKTKQLKLQVYKSEITVIGKMALVPESVQIDVSMMNAGDDITMKNFTLDKSLKVENEEASIGTINHIRNLEAVEPEVVK